MITLINNKFVEEKDAQFPISSSIVRGYGIFETLRTYNKNLLKPELHIKRLLNSAKKIDLEIKYSTKEIMNMLKKIVKKGSQNTQRIKIIAIPEKIIITSTEIKIDEEMYKGVSCLSQKAKREMPEVKSISYLTSYLAHTRAAKKGYFDAILIDENKEVYECAYANLFWFEKNILCTRKNDVLPGITRQIVMDISPFKIKFKTCTLGELKKKDEVFLTSSIKGIVPITKIDKTKIKLGKNTQELIRKLGLLISKVSKN